MPMPRPERILRCSEAAQVQVQASDLRKQLAAAIEALIDVLDVIDGDPDHEDDDPSGGNSEDEGEADQSAGASLPLYRLDQSRGPRNAPRVIDGCWPFDRGDSLAPDFGEIS